MAKRRKRKAAAADAGGIDPHEVLAGRVEVDAGLLLDLIHRINPTGLGVSGAQQRSRYQLKSGLQSLLVERFADELVFEAEPGSDKVARIRHRYSARDACHAVLTELDIDARAVVRRKLDEQASAADRTDEEARGRAAGRSLKAAMSRGNGDFGCKAGGGAQVVIEGKPGSGGVAGPGSGDVKEGTPGNRGVVGPRRGDVKKGKPRKGGKGGGGGGGEAAPGSRDQAAGEAAGGNGARCAAGGGDDALGAGALLARGNAALEAYRYDDAERDYRLAVERSGGETAAAGALLELLVDHLADYANAVRVAGELPPQTMRDPVLRVLAGKAAARNGGAELAMQYVARIRSAGTAEVYASLAADALRAGEVDRAAEHLVRAREIARDAAEAGDADAAPLLLETERMTTELNERRARQREPEERKVEQLLNHGEVEQAEQQARQLLERWPDSRVARAVLKLIEEDRAQKQIRGLVQQADEAYARGDRAKALQRLREAVTAGGEGPQLRKRIEAIEQELRNEQELYEVQRIVEVFRGKPQGDQRFAGLLAYLALDDGMRAKVREQETVELLCWLDQLNARRTGAGARSAAEAVLALRSASEALEQNDAERALALIEPHREVLERAAFARRIAGRAQEALAERRREKSLRLLASAEQALERGDHGQAARLLHNIEPRELDGPERSRADELQVKAKTLADKERLVELYHRCLEAGELLQARDTLKEIAELAEGEERASWLDKLQPLSAEIRALWRVRVIQGSAASRIGLRDFDPFPGSMDKSAWLTLDGREMVAVVARGSWLLLRVVETATGQVRTAVVLQTPEPLGTWPVTSVQERSVCVLSRGRLLELSLQSWEVLRWCAYDRLPELCKGTDMPVLMPGGRFLWVNAHETALDWKTAVLDLEQQRVSRILPGNFGTLPLWVRGRTIAIYLSDERTRAFSESGVASDFPLPADLTIEDATACPNGRDIALLLQSRLIRADSAGALFEDEDVAGSDKLLTAAIASPDGTLGPPFPLEDTDSELVHGSATCSSAGLLFVLAHSAFVDPRLWALRAERQRLIEEYRVFVSDDAVLARDIRSEHAALVDAGSEGPCVFPLCSTEPLSDNRVSRQGDVRLPSFSPPFFCFRVAGENHAASLARMGVLTHAAPNMRAEKIAQFVESGREKPESLWAMYEQLLSKGLQSEAEELAEQMAALGSPNPVAVFPLAERYCKQQRWEDMTALLDPFVPEALDGPCGEHLCHLLALALIAGGRAGEALDLLRSGVERFSDGPCDLDLYLQLAEPLPEPLRAKHWLPSESRVRQLAGATATADLCLTGGDIDGARAAIDRHVVWKARELQSTARLAEVYLRLDERGDEVTLFFKIRALAELCYLIEESEHEHRLMERELPFPGRIWNRERLSELAGRARSWLDGFEGAR